MPGWSSRAISCAGDVLPLCHIFSQMARCSTLTLSWSQGEKRCRTSLGPCWWRAARPIRRRGVSHHVTASPIAIYFTIGQMKRLILTICSLMCSPLPRSLFPSPCSFSETFPSLYFPLCQLLALAETEFWKTFVMLAHVSGHNKRRELCGEVI